MGLAYSLFREMYPPSPEFAVESIQDLSGTVALVTGANVGIGKETARVLLTKNAKVWIACRDVSKGEAALRELKDLTGKDAHLLRLDLSNLRSVKGSAKEFLGRETQLHLLINNAGVMHPPVDKVTDDGYDLQFGTNVLGHFCLTDMLLPLLISTAKSSPAGTVRVVNVSSLAHRGSALKFDTFIDGPKRRAESTSRLYGQSKTGNIVFSNELHRRYHDQGIVSIALHPGIINSDLMRHHATFNKQIGSWFLWDVEHGALTQLYAATAVDAANLSGQYLVPWARIGTPHASTQDPQLGKELWRWLEEQVAKV